ncbi:MAG: putative bifunctional diguanylate cyclase/phosphodiesterase [Ilumatobacter sp.]|uniref:putative bifunctional diguanylate cyclase/phosphodiesterase n=1 Tax=Ilumatobacter sp. TaxID=1967498 RepID=UPI0039190A48
MTIEHAADTLAAPTGNVAATAANLLELPEHLRGLLDADGTGVAIIGPDGHVAQINRVMMSLIGADSVDDLAPESPSITVLRSLLDHVPLDVFAPELESDAAPTRARHDRTWQGDFDHRTLGGTTRLLRATVHATRSERADETTIALLVHDVSESRRERALLHHRATHDPLTGLDNRPSIMLVLAQAIASQRDRRGHVAALFVDLDHLKFANDAFGHQVGDQLLASTSHRLAQAVRPADRVARLGGDEFLVVCADITDAITALELAERARRALRGHLRIGELDLDFSVSVGVALTDADVFDLDDEAAAALLISNADTAMYQAKQQGRDRCTLFTTQMRASARERTEMAAALARSVSDGDLTVDYQTVFSSVTGEGVAAEALVRWTHPTQGRIDPATFIGVAEESGIIGKLGEVVLDRALGDLAAWIGIGTVNADFAVHVNVSGMQLGSNSFVNTVSTMLRVHEIEPHQLVLEIRDTSLSGRVGDVERSIRALRRAGVRIAVDNFGTGPKSIGVMTDVGADVIKLDGALALPSGVSDAETRLVRAVVLLAHALDMTVVAERVSGTEQLRRLRSAGCDLVQGNLLAPPRPADELRTVPLHGW